MVKNKFYSETISIEKRRSQSRNEFNSESNKEGGGGIPITVMEKKKQNRQWMEVTRRTHLNEKFFLKHLSKILPEDGLISERLH